MHQSNIVRLKQFGSYRLIKLMILIIVFCPVQVGATTLAERDKAVELFQEAQPQVTSSQESQPLGHVLQNLSVYKLSQMLRNMQLKRIKNYLNVPLLGNMRLSSKFGMRQDPVRGGVQRHRGVDLSTAAGTPILAVASGQVVTAGWHHAYGLNIEIEHSLGWRTRYAHARLLYVTAGQAVESGQFIGQVGSTGRSTGPHLHFEIWQNGQPIDPYLVVQGLPARYKQHERSLPAVH
jgi:murein DD-endopeptidase MepM/ murein hydrolase activator NlpD